MSGRSKNCGCKASGKKQRIEGRASGYSTYYPDKENKLIATQRYLEAMPVSRTRTVVREQVIEETSSDMMLRSTTYSKMVSQQTTYCYQSASQEKSTAKKLRQPLTDVNEKYFSQVEQRPTFMVTSTAKRSLYPKRPLALDVSGVSSIRSTGRKGSQRPVTSTAVRTNLPPASSTQLSLTSSRYPYSTINDSEIPFVTSEKLKNVTLESSRASFATLNVKYLTPQSSRQATLKSSPFPYRSEYKSNY